MKHLAVAASSVAALLLLLPLVRAEPDAQDAYKDIKAKLGFVPQFFHAVPDASISAAWDEMRAIEMNPKTALPNKTKELIGLAVAAQVPCKYCVYVHTTFAKGNGANDNEIKEAVAMAAITRTWSTVLNGMQIDQGQFETDVKHVMGHTGEPKTPKIEVVDAASAYKDIERTLGFAPSFFHAMPDNAIAPAWREMKSLEMNPATQLPGKTKELIGLAVAAQIPCKYCVVFHTEAAKKNGATQQEIQEAVAMAGLTRHWSTILNGNQIDETQFRKDIDQIAKQECPVKTEVH